MGLEAIAIGGLIAGVAGGAMGMHQQNKMAKKQEQSAKAMADAMASTPTAQASHVAAATSTNAADAELKIDSSSKRRRSFASTVKTPTGVTSSLFTGKKTLG